MSKLREFQSALQDVAAGHGVESIENHLLQSMASNGSKDLIAAIAESEADILADIQRVREEKEDDAPLKFKVTLGITLDLDKSTVDTAFSYSIKKSVKHSHVINRPDEPEFEFESGEEAA